MGEVIQLAEEKFRKVNAAKILDACSVLDEEVRKLVFDGDVPAHELLVALTQRIGVYLSCTDADRERVVKKLAKVMYKAAVMDRHGEVK